MGALFLLITALLSCNDSSRFLRPPQNLQIIRRMSNLAEGGEHGRHLSARWNHKPSRINRPRWEKSKKKKTLKFTCSLYALLRDGKFFRPTPSQCVAPRGPAEPQLLVTFSCGAIYTPLVPFFRQCTLVDRIKN